MLYNDISPLENHHCAVAFQVLDKVQISILLMCIWGNVMGVRVAEGLGLSSVELTSVFNFSRRLTYLPTSVAKISRRSERSVRVMWRSCDRVQ